MTACVVIPIYNTIPTADEVLSIRRNISVLADYDIYAVCAQSMDVSAYEEFGFKEYKRYDDKYFKSNKSYSRLLLSDWFYADFSDYEYMLIAQTDTYILNTDYKLADFIAKGYDYWGAPWPNGPLDEPYGLREYVKGIFVHHPHDLHVGNGGFSLRKISTAIALTKKSRCYIKYVWRLNEDLFFSVCARKGLCTAAPIDEASTFALETNMQDEISKGNIPYAVHAWRKYYKGNIEDIYN